MDRTQFDEVSPGKLVQISAPLQPSQTDWAFVPNELPSGWQFPDNEKDLLGDAREALGTLNGIGQTLPNPQLLLRPLQTKESTSSTTMEGTFVTPQQLLMFELDPKAPLTGTEESANGAEAYNYTNALNRGCSLLESLPVCHRVIKEMHFILMQGVRGRDKAPGEFRRWQVQLGSSGRFIPPPPQEVPRLMDNFEKYVNSDDGNHALIRCFVAHYQFEAIHPFTDGNGRIGRALLALMIYKALSHSMPWLYLSSFFEKFKDEYVNNMFRVSSDGDWTQWVKFCLRGTIFQAHDSIRRCHAFNALKRQFHELLQEKSATSRSHAIVDDLFQSPIVSITVAAKKHKVAYHTAQADLERLVDLNIMNEMTDVRPRTFFAPAIMKIAFGNMDERQSAQ